MKIILHTLVLLCFVSQFYAQENSGYRIISSNLGSSGSSQTLVTAKGTYKISQSIGQASVIGTYSNNGYYLRQGYQQPQIEIQAVEVLSHHLEANVFPNPFSQIINIRFSNTILNDISVLMFDLNAKIIHNETFLPAQKVELNIKDISSGTYFLKVVSGKEHFNTKLIKI